MRVYESNKFLLKTVSTDEWEQSTIRVLLISKIIQFKTCLCERETVIVSSFFSDKKIMRFFSLLYIVKFLVSTVKSFRFDMISGLKNRNENWHTTTFYCWHAPKPLDIIKYTHFPFFFQRSCVWNQIQHTHNTMCWRNRVFSIGLSDGLVGKKPISYYCAIIKSRERWFFSRCVSFEMLLIIESMSMSSAINKILCANATFSFMLTGFFVHLTLCIVSICSIHHLINEKPRPFDLNCHVCVCVCSWTRNCNNGEWIVSFACPSLHLRSPNTHTHIVLVC